MAEPNGLPSFAGPSVVLAQRVESSDGIAPQAKQWTKEQFRPSYHYTPSRNWMSDPNGMVYFDGLYHLCYQHDAYDSIFQNMSWGHAVSTDLLNWRECSPIITPDESLGMCFSGCMVVDKDNTSGLGKNALVGFYTSELPRQQQSMVYSCDGGETFQKYRANPVIEATSDRSPDFRDPKIFWYSPGDCWVMSVAGPERIEFWSSENLIDWQPQSCFGEGQGVHGCQWECPDLRLMPVDGQDDERWVLLVSVNPEAPNGGTGTMYFVGSFGELDGKLTFVSEHSDPRWLDWGKDNYAGVAWTNLEDSDNSAAVLFIGWMSNWQYATSVPTAPWRGVMTLIRQLRLQTFPSGLSLTATPAPFYSQLDGAALLPDRQVLDRPLHIGPDLNVSRLSLLLEVCGSDDVGVEFSNSSGDSVRIGLAPGVGFFVDRRNGGVDFHEDFPGLHYAACEREMGSVQLEVYLDRCSVEVFANDGEFAITELVFPTAQLTTLRPIGAGSKTDERGGQSIVTVLEAIAMQPIQRIVQMRDCLQSNAKNPETMVESPSGTHRDE